MKAFSEWNLPLIRNTKKVQEIFKDVLRVSDWLEADSILMNCLFNLMQLVTVMDVGKSCVLMEIKGKPLIKIILAKTLSLSSKTPHTENNMSLIRNGLSALKCCSNYVEVRVMLKNSKIFQTLEVLHPQLHPTRKTSWDDVTVEWMKFFDTLSQFEDTECQPQ